MVEVCRVHIEDRKSSRKTAGCQDVEAALLQLLCIEVDRISRKGDFSCDGESLNILVEVMSEDKKLLVAFSNVLKEVHMMGDI